MVEFSSLLEGGTFDVDEPAFDATMDKGQLGNTALMICAENGWYEGAKLLLQKGANVLIRNEWGKTPLHFACETGNLEITLLLIENKSNLEAVALSVPKWVNEDKTTNFLQVGVDVDEEEVSDDLNRRGNIIPPVLQMWDGNKGARPLHMAVSSGRLECVELLLTAGADVNTGDDVGNSPCMLAAKNLNLNMLQLLLSTKQNLNLMLSNTSFQTALDIAVQSAERDDGKFVKILLEKGADPNLPNLKERPTLVTILKAVTLKKFEEAKLLVEYGANLQVVNNEGKSLLQIAMELDHKEMVELLVDAEKISINHQDLKGNTPLLAGCCKNSIDSVRSLLHNCKDKEFDVNLPNLDGNAALHEALLRGYTDLVMLLLSDNRTDTDRHGKRGSTALCIAVARGYMECVLELLKVGAAIDAVGVVNQTALTVAADCKHLDILEVLLQHNASPNLQDEDGCTCIMRGVNAGFLEGVSAILKTCKDVDLELMDNSDKTALACALLQPNPEFVTLLLQNGAAVDIQDFEGATPLMVAARGGGMESVSELLKFGADVNKVDHKGRSSLWYALQKSPTQKFELALTLLDHGASPNSYYDDTLGLGWLHYAIMEDNHEFAERWAGLGGDISMCGGHARVTIGPPGLEEKVLLKQVDPLSLCVLCGKKEMLDILLKLSNRFVDEAFTAAVVMDSKARAEVGEFKVKSQKKKASSSEATHQSFWGMDTKHTYYIKNESGAAEQAVQFYRSMVETLLDAGANPDSDVEDWGCTALTFYVSQSDYFMMLKLLEYGADSEHYFHIPKGGKPFHEDMSLQKKKKGGFGNTRNSALAKMLHHREYHFGAGGLINNLIYAAYRYRARPLLPSP
ncbi:hypothetical protein CYMTET_20309 [Cymbomonas tetramitiformis]|uniref:Uncharacterized protein n=1 Tax=Cymbomonas tetramitiformis TaxID=36881 RepID=A0AAE0G4B3_9CHLO|nr:hypothetical protein CYMTET_20309 [Cymbomonas tetramitiformis]